MILAPPAAPGCSATVEGALARAAPEPTLLLAGLAGDDLDVVRHHEGGIKPYPELTDKADVTFRILAFFLRPPPP